MAGRPTDRPTDRAAWEEGFARVLICGRELNFGEPQASDGEERDGLVDRLEKRTHS
jgi:hypothetical protein